MDSEEEVRVLEARVLELETELRNRPSCPWPHGCLHPEILREETLMAVANHLVR